MREDQRKSMRKIKIPPGASIKKKVNKMHLFAHKYFVLLGSLSFGPTFKFFSEYTMLSDSFFTRLLIITRLFEPIKATVNF